MTYGRPHHHDRAPELARPWKTARMDSTMQDVDLLVSDILEHGARVHPGAHVVH